MFKQMVQYLENKETDRFKVEKFTISEEEVRHWRFREPDLKAGDFVRLMDKKLGDVVMSDTPMEHRTNMDLIRNGKGDILVGGLGIGMVLMVLQDKPEVNSITVVEKYEDVIELVAKQLPLNEKVNIIQGDIFDWKASRGSKYDTIYFDIWNYVCGDNLEEMKRLKSRFRPRLNKGGYIGCWAEYECRRGRL